MSLVSFRSWSLKSMFKFDSVSFNQPGIAVLTFCGILTWVEKVNYVFIAPVAGDMRECFLS